MKILPIVLLLILDASSLFAGSVSQFAREELDRMASGQSSKIEMRTNPQLAPFAFAMERKGEKLVLEGHGEPELLQAVYTALEQMGYRFEVTGPVSPASVSWELIPASRQVFTPAIQRRGVRQHINFNMDVSGYPIAEAREYIRNLARLRYNFMTFHSYPCHWTRDRLAHGALFGDFQRWMRSYNPKPDDLVSGGYFYGGEFRIPNHPLIKPSVRFNQEYFCAPEFEKVIHTQPERAEKAREWLQAVMAEAKRCGMLLQLSTELRLADNQYNQGLADRIMADYPLIDLLEFISTEAGDMKDAAQVDANRAMAQEIINGSENAKESVGGKPELSAQIRSYAKNIRLIRHLRATGWDKKNKVTLVCGSYACRAESIRLEVELAEKFLEADQVLGFMPGHSSREVSALMQEVAIKPELLKRTMIYSWVEFDGYMMLQQQATHGFYDLVQQVSQSTGKPLFGIACNHWRTAPNALSFRYLSRLSFDSKLDPENFFTQTARVLGIIPAQSGEFLKAMNTIDELSGAGAIAGNIGFNLGWAVNPVRTEPGKNTKIKGDLGIIWWWGRKNLEIGRDRFLEAGTQLQGCRKGCSTEAGRVMLDQLVNGVNCSIEHLKGVLEIKNITDKYFDKSIQQLRTDLSPSELAYLVSCTNQADMHFQNYLKLLSGHLSDRGEEGMLVTYYWAPVVFCNNIRAVFGNQGKFIRQNEEGEVVPQPLTVSDEKRMGQ